ncbi:MAG: hypothetical protein ACI4RD_06750 [Kiritimatiellia bacterium]
MAGVGLVVVAAVFGCWWLLPEGGRSPEAAAPGREAPAVAADDGREAPAPERSGAADGLAPADVADEPQTEAEKAAAAAEAKVEAFDLLTDRWMEPSKTGVSMQAVEDFAAAFRQVPKERQDECVHRALNLIPDENVMLLAGILMDKAMDREIVEAVFNDVLNRGEEVKRPILQQIFKDKTHSCWEDTAWILDVTGELPKADSK